MKVFLAQKMTIIKLKAKNPLTQIKIKLFVKTSNIPNTATESHN